MSTTKIGFFFFSFIHLLKPCDGKGNCRDSQKKLIKLITKDTYRSTEWENLRVSDDTHGREEKK